MLIVDNFRSGDSRGMSRDAFATAAMSGFFAIVSHVNSIISVCMTNELRTTLLAPVFTYMSTFHATGVQKCLRMVYNFSDSAKMKAGETRKPESSESTRSEAKFMLQSMLLKITPVPTEGGAETCVEQSVECGSNLP